MEQEGAAYSFNYAPSNFRLSVKFSTHMIKSAREKIDYNCTNCFRSIVLLVFALATALKKFRFL